MNLNYDPSPESLQALLASAASELPSHYIAVDYDGEVIIDPDLQYPDVDVSRYKYCTKIRDVSLRNARKLQALHAKLVKVLTVQFHPLGSNDYNIAA